MKRITAKILLLAFCLLANNRIQAQTLDEAIQFIKYERYESAKSILTPLSATDAKANYYLGLCELAKENLAGAKTIFQKYPEDVANNAGLARVMILENKTPDAMTLLTKVAGKVKKKDWLPFKYAADALTYTEGGDPNKAIEWYKLANEVMLNGDNYIGMGDAYRKMQGGGGNAMTNYEYAETYPTTQSIANTKMGNLWYAAKNYDSALAKYARASALDAKNPLPYKALADAYYKINKFKISKENIEKYLELSDKTIDDQIQYANTLYLAKDYAGAIQKMNELIGKGTEKPYMYRVLGFSQFETKDFGNALINMNKLFAKQDPAKIIPLDYIYFGKLLSKDSTKTNEAAAAFAKGIQVDTATDKSATMRGIAETYYDLLSYANAAMWYQKIIDTGTPLFEDFWWCGVMNYYAKNYQQADATFAALAIKYPEEPSCIFWRARIAAADKDAENKTGAASDLFKQWITMIKEDPAKKKDLTKAYTYLAIVSFNTGKKEDAKLYCDKLVAFDKDDATAKQILGLLPSLK